MSREVAIPNAKALLKLLEQFELYTKNLQEQPLSAHTKRAYETRLQHFLGFLGVRLHDYPDALTSVYSRDQLTRDYSQYLKLQIKSHPQTVNAYLTAIDSFFTFLGLGKASISREAAPNSPPNVLTALEEYKFLSAINRSDSARDKALAILLLRSGIRISECYELDIDDVQFSKTSGVLAVQRIGQSRRIPLSNDCIKMLHDWVRERAKITGKAIDSPLFVSNRGNRLSIDSIDYVIRKLAKEAGLKDVSSNTLRCTFLAKLVSSSNDIEVVSRLAGHQKIENTKRYAVFAKPAEL